MLVLVGPQGSGKKDLAQKLVEEFQEYFGYWWVVIHVLVGPQGLGKKDLKQKSRFFCKLRICKTATREEIASFKHPETLWDIQQGIFFGLRQ